MLSSLGQDSAGVSKDTTQWPSSTRTATLRRDASGGWVQAPSSQATPASASVRGEQFWLDETGASKIRPHAPAHTLAPSMVFWGDTPMMARHASGDNQDQTILQAFLSIVDFWDDWYPLHVRSNARGSDALRCWLVLAAQTGLTSSTSRRLFPTPYNELRALPARREPAATFGMSGATAVAIDPASGNVAAGDPRRDCYAMAC